MPRRSAVLIVAVPHVYATALAFNLRQLDRYDVFVPNVAEGEDSPEDPFDVAVTNLPIPASCARVTIRVPESMDEGFAVTVGDVSVQVNIESESYVDGLLRLVDEYAVGDDRYTGEPAM